MKKIGTYKLGYRWVEVFVNKNSTGGCFKFFPAGSKIVRMEVGIKDTENYSWGVLLHETLEALLSDGDYRLRIDGRMADTMDAFVFHFNHQDFSEICAQAGDFICAVKNDFIKATEPETKKKPK